MNILQGLKTSFIRIQNTITNNAQHPLDNDGIFLVALLFVAGVVFASWFKNDYLIYFWDGMYSLAPDLALKAYSSVWHDFSGFGVSDITGIKMIPYLFVLFLLHNIFGLTLQITQEVLYYLLFGITGLSAFYFIRAILPNSDPSTIRIASFCGALFYMFNMYAMLFLWRIFSVNLFLYAVLPLIALICIEILNAKRVRPIKLVIIFILFVFASPAHPSILILMFLTILAGIAVKITTNLRTGMKPFILNGLLLLTVVFSANLYWIVPVAASAGTIPSLSNPYGGTDTALQFNSMYADPWQILQLKGQQILYEQYYGEYDYSWVTQYHESQISFINGLSIIIPILVGLSLFSIRKSRKMLMTTISVFALLFFVKGTHEPLGFVYQFLFDTVPGFNAFRDPYSKFGLFYTFFLAISVAAGSQTLVSKLATLSSVRRFEKMRYLLVFAVIFLLCGVYMWPMWTGAHIPEGTEIRPSARITVPSEYWILANDIKNEPEAIFFELPFQDRPLQSLNFRNGYVGFPILQHMTYGRIISGIVGSEPQDTLYRYISSVVESSDSTTHKALFLKNLGIKYLVLHEDSNTNFVKEQNSATYIRDLLATAENINFYRQYGEVSIWEVDLPMQPLVYAFPKQENEELFTAVHQVTLPTPSLSFGNGRVLDTNDKYVLECTISNNSKYCDFTVEIPTGFGDHIIFHDVRTSNAFFSISYIDHNGEAHWPSSSDPPLNQTTRNYYSLPSPYSLHYDVVSSSEITTVAIHLNPGQNKDDTFKAELSKEFSIDTSYKIRSALFDLSKFNPVNVDFEKVSETKYKLFFSDEGHVLDKLVFMKPYDPHWKASVNGKALEHEKLLGYFNGYTLPVMKDKYEIVLEYELQLYYDIGSAATLIGFLLLLGIIYRVHIVSFFLFSKRKIDQVRTRT